MGEIKLEDWINNREIFFMELYGGRIAIKEIGFIFTRKKDSFDEIMVDDIHWVDETGRNILISQYDRRY